MRGETYSRHLVFIVMALFSISFVCAATSSSSNWYYPGDTFKIGDVVYSIEGSDYEKVLLGVGSQLYVIRLDDCVQTPNAKYCYDDTAYPSDEAHIKYSAGQQLFGYYLTISSVAPSVTITRTASTQAPRIGDSFDIIVDISNDGDYPINDLVYTEKLPDGFTMVNQDAIHSIKSLPVGKTERFTYSMKGTDYSSGVLQPNVTYVYNSQKYSTSVTPLTISVVSPLSVTRDVTPTIYLGETGNYTLALNNTDAKETMVATVLLGVPSLFHVKDSGVLTAGTNSTYNYVVSLKPGESSKMTLFFIGSSSISTYFPLDIDVAIGSSKFRRHYEDKVQSKIDGIVPSIKLSSERQVYRAGDTLTFKSFIYNSNPSATFYSISGTLDGGDLFKPVDFNQEVISAKKDISQTEVAVPLPMVDDNKTFNITLRGSYKLQSGDPLSFYTSRLIKVKKFNDLVNVTYVIEPQIVNPGNNLTITVSGQNVYDQYVTFSAHDTYDSLLDKVGGLTYAETFLERDEKNTLYIYQLKVPLNYSYNSTTVKTQILVKGEDLPAEFTIDIPVNVTYRSAGVISENETADTALNGTGDIDGSVKPSGDSSESLGFFASLWDFIKGIFN